MKIYEIQFQGIVFNVKASDDMEAVRKFAADYTGEDCECGLPQWGEDAAAAGEQLCECVEWVRD